MVAKNYDLLIEQGATFTRVITWQDSAGAPINLDGYNARMQFKSSPSSDASFINMTTDNGQIELGGSAGTITLKLDANQTSEIDEASGVYDLEIISSGGEVTRLLQGNVVISREVTKNV